MSKISLYDLAPEPKLSDRLIGTSVGFDSQNQTYNQTYNFSLQELLDLFIPNISSNNLQGILDNGNTATQDIHLNGTIYTTHLDVASSANFTDVYLLGQTYLRGQLSDSTGNIGSVGQVLVSLNTGGTQWETLYYVPLTRTITINGETHDLSANRTWTVATGVMNITVDSPLGTSGGANPNLSISKAGASQDGYLSSTDWNTFNSKGTGSVTSVTAVSPISSTGGTTPAISISQSSASSDGYLSSTDWSTFNGKQAAGDYITSLIGEATATGPGAASVTLGTSAVTGKLLTGLNLTAGGSISATDSILTAFGKTQNQISALLGGVLYKGVWDASTNTPTLTSSVGTQGWYYIVNVAGSTNLNGITDWQVGDWAIFNGTVWNKVDNTDAVSSVNGFTGAVNLTTDNVPEGTTNLYYLDSRARTALSFVAGSGAYNSTTGVITIPTNNNQITNGAGYITSSALSSYVPYTGATADVNLGAYDLYTSKVWLYDNPNSAYGSMELTDGVLHFEDANGHSMITMEDGYLTIANASTIRALLNVSGLSANRDYAFPNVSGTVALTSDLSSYVPTSRQLTINGTAYDLSADRTWSVGTVTSVAALTIGTTGTDLSSSVANSTTIPVITLNVPTASATNRGALSSADWTTFNNKVTGTGTTNTLPKFTAASTIGNSNITDDGTLITLGSNSYVNGSLGVGTSSLTGFNLRVDKNITGATTSFNVSSVGTVQSDVTATAYSYRSSLSTQAASFTISNLQHYFAQQGTIGAGSTVTNQYGFNAASSLVGATNNYGFYGNLPISGTSNWNAYMSGTAPNYFGGAIGVGSATLNIYNLRMQLNLTGGTTFYNIYSGGTIQSDVTGNAYYFRTNAATQATAFTLSNLYHYTATQSTIGSGSTVTNQYGFIADSTLTGATNNYGFYGQIASGTGRYNLYMSGDADNYMLGRLGIGASAAAAANVSLRLRKTITGGVNSYSILSDGVVQSDVTTGAYYFASTAQTLAAAFTLSQLYHFQAGQSTIGSGSTVTSQYGFYVANNLIGATNNYGFYGNLASAANVWNLYMSGSASNYIAGSLGIGTTSLTGYSLRLTKTITGTTSSFGIQQDGVIQSDVTTAGVYYSTNVGTQATSFTLTTLYHYRAIQGTFGSGSTITTQHGFYVDSTLTGGTNNYGFYGNIASATGRYNLYMNGTATNFLQGELQLGSGQVVSASVLSTVTNKIKLIINGTTYYLLASTSGT